VGVSNFDAVQVEPTPGTKLQLNPYGYETIHFFISGAQTTGTKKAAMLRLSRYGAGRLDLHRGREQERHHDFFHPGQPAHHRGSGERQ
jgi:hypothetical protein